MPAGDAAPARPVFRVPIGPRLFTLLAVLLVGGVTLFMAAAAVYLLVLRQWGLAALTLVLAAVMAGLTDYLVRDLRGKWGLRVAMEADVLVLDLPFGRLLIHRPAAQHLKIPYSGIEAIEPRLEAYATFGMAMLQRAYVLHRKDGQLIFLFEDRAIETRRLPSSQPRSRPGPTYRCAITAWPRDAAACWRSGERGHRIGRPRTCPSPGRFACGGGPRSPARSRSSSSSLQCS